MTVIRATEIRGHLRFWWRACRGGQFNTLADLKKAEDELWGSAATEDGGGPSKVQVEVKPLSEGHVFQVEWKKKGQKITSTEVGNPDSPYSYVAFPLNEDKGTVLDGISFWLKITFPEIYRTDVEAALWAWETFGGIGARTRRGFGALQLDKVDSKNNTDLPPPERAKAEKWLLQKFEDYVSPGKFPENVPYLQHRPLFFVTRKATDPLKVWQRLFVCLKDFRQQRRNKEGQWDKFGHSDWPEPNAIRRLFKSMLRGPHSNRKIQKFPRAVFGLPLIFHLEHDREIEDTTLQGKDKEQERLASPLILRPLACAERTYVGIALILAGSKLPDNLILKDAPGGDSIEVELTPQEAQRIPPLNGNPDVLQAFLNTLKQKEN